MNAYPNTPLRGTFFRTPSERGFADAMSEGLTFTLLREPTNEYDSNAIKVIFTDPDDPTFSLHLGYVAREVAAWIAPELDAGEPSTCVLSSIEREGRKTNYLIDITTGE